MTQRPSPHASQNSLEAVSLTATRRDGWTAERQTAFLRMLAATQSVAQAAKSVGMSRQSAYKLRARLDDAPFGAGWRMAMKGGRGALLEAALDRAINGIEVPHYWQGELVGTSRRYDERLTALLLNSGALANARATVNGAEDEFAHHGLSRLLDRIESGPRHWRGYAEERNDAWGDDGYDDDDGYDNDDDNDDDGEASDRDERSGIGA
ncbi:MAG: hypothetical protein WBA51_05465 [Erythrobacter sp.]